MNSLHNIRNQSRIEHAFICSYGIDKNIFEVCKYSYEMSIYFLLIQSISSIQNVNKIYNNNLQNVR